MLKRLLSAIAAFSLAVAPVPTWAADSTQDYAVHHHGSDLSEPKIELAQLLLGVTNVAASGVLAGTPTGLTITNTDWTTISDLAPASQFVQGYSGMLVLSATTPAGATTAYDLGAGSNTANGAGTSAKLTFTDVKPGFDSSGNATTVSKTIWATNWLRQTYNNGTLPTEAANSGNARIGLVFNDLVFHNDTPGTATSLSALYTSGAVTSTATLGIPVTNNSTLTYPMPIGVWVTPPGVRIGSGQNFTVEFFGGQMFGQGGQPAAVFTAQACDAAKAHCTSVKTTSTMTTSVRQPATSCTGTNGSSVLTSCGDTTAFIPGQRLTVPGVPGTPKLLSKTSTSLTLGTTATCTTTLNSGVVALPATGVLNGDGLADGAFNGATITDANFTTPAGVATITAEPTTADVTTVSLKPTTVNLTTNATGVTAGTAAACTINHVYQGTTGSVKATVGNPVPVWAITFAASDFTGASLSDGVIGIEGVLKPVIGDVVLDTQNGADGTGCDWFFKNVNGGVCPGANLPGTSAASYNANGTDITPNVHNLWAYLDTAQSYDPAYVWVKPTGTCTTSACASSSATDPGGAVSNYAASAFQAQANIKSYYNTRTLSGSQAHHNDAQGGVICETAGTYAGFGGNLSTAAIVNKPPLTLTSALVGGDCPLTGAANSDVANVILGHNATSNFNTVASGMRFNNITASDSGVVIQIGDGALNTTFNTAWLVFNNSVLRNTAGAAILYKTGTVWRYGGIADGSAGDGGLFKPAAGGTGSFNTFFETQGCVPFTTTSAASAYSVWNTVGVNSFGCSPNNPAQLQTLGINYTTQPISTVIAYNRFMGGHAGTTAFQDLSNVLMTTSIFEQNNTNSVAGLLMSGDSSFLSISNVWRSYTTVSGARSNMYYAEGVPLRGSSVATGGTFAAGTYYVQVGYSRTTATGGPANCVPGGTTTGCVETSTDGLSLSGGSYTNGLTIVLNGSINLALPCDPNYVATVYVGLIGDISGSGNTSSLGHYATVAATDAKTLAMCQNVVLTAQGSAHSAPTVAGTSAHGALKLPIVDRFNIDMQFNNKADYFGLTTGQAGAVGSGGRAQNLQPRYRVGWMGDVAITKTVISGGGADASYGGGLGELLALNDKNNAVAETDLSFVKFRRNRSVGDTAASPQSPATNLGWGDYHIDTSVTNPVGVVPTGLAQWPWDIEGTTRKSGATACGGAYEC